MCTLQYIYDKENDIEELLSKNSYFYEHKFSNMFYRSVLTKKLNCLDYFYFLITNFVTHGLYT